MEWELYKKNHRERRTQQIPRIGFHNTGISVNDALVEKWANSCRFVELLIDRQERRAALRFVESPTLNSYRLTFTGTKRPQRKITCKGFIESLHIDLPYHGSPFWDDTNGLVVIDLPQTKVSD